jgi:hypothetical protein
VILFSIAFPGRFSDWCGQILKRLAEEAGGHVVYERWPPLDQLLDYRPVGSALEQIARVLIGNDADHVVCSVCEPDDHLRIALERPEMRFLLALNDPLEAAVALLAETGQDPKRIIRAVANSCAHFDRCRHLPGALTLDLMAETFDPATLLDAVAAHFRISTTPDAVAAILWDLEFRDLSAHRATNDGSELSQPISKMIDGALLPYREYFAGGRLPEFVWTRDLFLFPGHDNPAEPLDVSGGSRVLVFGPFIHLLSGAWSARMLLGFSEEAIGHSFTVDVFHFDRQLAVVTFQPAAAGLYTAELNFSVTGIRGHGVELRLMVASDNAKGSVAFGHVTLNPLGPRADGSVSRVAEDFRAVLEL